MRIRESGRIAGSVREKNSVGIEREHLFRSCRCGNNRDAKSFLAQQAQNIFLHAVIVSGNAKSDWGKRAFASATVARNRPRSA